MFFCRDKKKDFAPKHAAYYPIGLDVFLSPKKVHHIAQYVELPTINHSGKLPPILVVNAQVLSCLVSSIHRNINSPCLVSRILTFFLTLQIPLYPTTIFQNEIDGEGISFVMYFKLSENYAKELPEHFQESIRVSSLSSFS